MPLIENDVIFAFLNSLDKNHVIASDLMERLNGVIEAEFSSVALIEMELVYISQGLESRLLEDLVAVSTLQGIKMLSLVPDVAIAAAYIRKAQGLSFFDSHYAATALAGDGVIISFDVAYDKVPGLKRIDPIQFS